jgi:hypothetical protein
VIEVADFKSLAQHNIEWLYLIERIYSGKSLNEKNLFVKFGFFF